MIQLAATRKRRVAYIFIKTLSYCTPAVLISLKFSPMRLTPGLSSHHYHPEFGETLQYDTANGLAIDFAREREKEREWQMERKSKGNIWKGTRRKSVQGPRALDDTGRIVEKNSHNPDEKYNCARKDVGEVNSKYLKSADQKLE